MWNDALSFLLTTESERREHFTDCDGMLAVGVLCVTCRWRSRYSRSLIGHLTVGTRRLAAVHVSLSQSVRAGVAAKWCIPSRRAFCQRILQQSAEDYASTAKVDARTNDASTTFTTNMCGHKMTMLLWFDLTITNDSSPTTSGMESHVTVSHDLTFNWYELVVVITLIFFEITLLEYWKTCPSTVRYSTILESWSEAAAARRYAGRCTFLACTLTWLQCSRLFPARIF